MNRSQVLVSVLGGLVGLAFAIGLYLQYAERTGLSAQLASFRVVSDREVQVRVEIAREPGSATYCVARAQSATTEEVGRIAFDVPPQGPRTVTVTRSIPTTSRAVNGVLVGCGKGPAPVRP